jgi:hypothetical protein
MRTVGVKKKAGMGALLVLAAVVGIGACEKYPTRPVNRRPTISSVVAFPTVLGLGDSTLVTVFATDPDGDTLVYDWDAYNGLVTNHAPYPPTSYLFHTSSRSRVFYLERKPATYDTAFIWCRVRDVKGGSASRQVLFVLRD